MPSPPDLSEAILAAWRTNNRITLFLFEHLPPGLWAATVLVARALGHRLPEEVTTGLWQWSQRAAEAAAPGASPRLPSGCT